jgi:hypothetical protein
MYSQEVESKSSLSTQLFFAHHSAMYRKLGRNRTLSCYSDSHSMTLQVERSLSWRDIMHQDL